MDSAVAGLIGAGIGASTGFISTLLSSWLSLRRERDQWERSVSAERDKWLRDNLQEIYGNCLYYLSRVLMGSEITVESGKPFAVTRIEHQRELFLDYSEAQKWLGLLLVYHHSPGSSEYAMLSHHISIFSREQVPNLTSVPQLRQTIISLASKDLRLRL